MKILHYCQHVLGVGHFFRSMEIVRALAAAGFDVLMVSGGGEVPAELPSGARAATLPALMMDPEFKELVAGGDVDIETVKVERTRRLLTLMDEERPDILLVELFPFGRSHFRFELIPLLEGCRAGRFGNVRTVVSLRDILVEKRDQAFYEERTLKYLNAWFDLVLVHSDPALAPLDETFSRVADIAPCLAYTGYVAALPRPEPAAELRARLGVPEEGRLSVASAGGGKVGFELLAAAVEAWRLPDGPEGQLLVFGGPFMEEERFRQLQERAADCPRIRVERFSTRFLDLLAAADLSLSMAGYNTVMNILATGVPALVWPFAQNREQRMRAAKLERLGVLRILEDADLAPHVLVRLAREAMARGRRPGPSPVSLDGAARTARVLKDLRAAGGEA